MVSINFDPQSKTIELCTANVPCEINRSRFMLVYRCEALYLFALALAVLRSAFRSRLAPPISTRSSTSVG